MWHSRNREEPGGYRECGSGGGHFRGGPFKFGRGRGHHPDGPGGFGRRRGLYDSEELRLVLLSLIAEQPRHGYDLIREIEERTGGGYAPSPGIIYPTLTMLQDMGLIAESDTGGNRKVYTTTPEGTAHLAGHKTELDALLARITEARSAQKGGHGPVRRAMANLHSALVEKIAHADDEEVMHRIAALLDDVTQKIERS